ncbi:Clp protease N-terminal domain-containing protein [Micromonospora sp. NPDC005806]|uniref:Clp protease N-terminal domain-containing protein n=1 Tax=Micromonospora sp. NPDC005806 TaxID=3364234 RepID=UPI0036A4B82F
MFERFTGRARTAIRHAVDAARAEDPDPARHSARGVAGLTEADAAALRGIGIDLGAIVARVKESFGPDALRVTTSRRRGNGRWSPRAKKALALSRREAVRQRQHRIGTEHLLLGLLHETSGPVALALVEAGTDLGELRRRLAVATRTAA